MAPRTRVRREQGMALVAVMLLLMAMSALAAALAISSTTETLIARNHQAAAEARAAAEAGLTHAIGLTMEYLLAFPTPAAALDTLLTDPGAAGIDDLVDGYVLTGTTSSFSSTMFSSTASTHYVAMLLDDDNETARDLDLSADDVTRIGENGDPDDDANGKVVIRAMGFSRGNAVAAIEATLAPMDLPAILSAGDLEIGGKFTLSSTTNQGSVHTNGDFTSNGNAWGASDGCTASGGTDTPGNCPGGSAEINVPTRTAADYRSMADWTLNATGSILDSNGNVCTSGCPTGWTFTSGIWSMSGGITTGAYFVDGDVQLGGTGQVTIFTTGTVVGTGGTLQPSIAGLMLVADGDMYIKGNPTLGTSANPGAIIVGEQADIPGTPTIYGSIVIRDATSNDSTVTTSQLTGNFSVHYNGGLEGLFYTISAWRRSF